jgi:dihydromethanopterin reductase
MPEVMAGRAIGRRIAGLNGRMPEGAKGPEHTADVQRFFELTRGHVILLGPDLSPVPAFGPRGPHRRRDTPGERPADVIARHPDRGLHR